MTDSSWRASHARQAVAAHLGGFQSNWLRHDGKDFADYVDLPEAEKQPLLAKADGVLQALLDSEDSLRMMLIRGILGGKYDISVPPGGEFRVRERKP